MHKLATEFIARGADLSLVGIRREFPGFTAIENLDLQIPAGEFFALLGPSGCGKTTTLRLVAGLDTPTSGQILIGGEDVTYTKAYQRPVNTVFQSYALFPHMTILENVAFGLRQRKVSDPLAKATEALELVQLGHLANRRPQQLSGGQQQRVALARALVNRPSLLLLDEPLGALDLKLRREMQVELKAIQMEVGLTFLHVTHDQEEAMDMADVLVGVADWHDARSLDANEVQTARYVDALACELFANAVSAVYAAFDEVADEVGAVKRWCWGQGHDWRPLLNSSHLRVLLRMGQRMKVLSRSANFVVARSAKSIPFGTKQTMPLGGTAAR